MTPIAARPAASPAPEGSALDRRARSAGDVPEGGFAEALGAATAATAPADGERERVGIAVDGEDTASEGTSPEVPATEAAPSPAGQTPMALPVSPLDSWSAWLHWTATRAHDDVPPSTDTDEGQATAVAEPIGDTPAALVVDGGMAPIVPGNASHASTAPGGAAAGAAAAQGSPASGDAEPTVQRMAGPHPPAHPQVDIPGQALHANTPAQGATASQAFEPPSDVLLGSSTSAVPAARELAGQAAHPPASSAPAIVPAVPHDRDPGVLPDVALESPTVPALQGGSVVEGAAPDGAQGALRVDAASSLRAESSAATPLHTPLVVASVAPARPADAFDAMPSVEPPTTGETATAVVDQIVKGLRVQWKQGIGEARIQLRPDHLGPVDISIKVEGGAVTAVVRAESTQVQEWILGHQQSLRQQLEDAGLRLADLVVSPDAERRHKRGDQHEDDTPRPSQRRRAGEAEPIFEVVV